jgi:hypothetical protein
MYVKRTKGLGAAGDSLTASLASAIARFEGFGVPGSVAARNHNPGNLRSGIGQSGTDANGYAIFPDDVTGYAALDNQINLNIGRGLSLDEFFGGKPGVYAGFAPSTDSNNPTQYASTVAGWIGIDPSVPLASISSDASSEVSAPLIAGSSDASSEVSAPLIAGLALAAAGLLYWWASA